MAIVENIETHAKLSGKAFVPVPNYRETPPWLKGTADGSDAAKACVGWVYYADSSLWVSGILRSARMMY